MANRNAAQNLTDEDRSRGGQHSSGNFKHDPVRAAEAGRRGGEQSSGNFKNNSQRAAEAGRKGGGNSGGNTNKNDDSDNN